MKQVVLLGDTAFRRGEAFAVGMHISPYEKGNIFNRDPIRDKRLLLHRAEIRKLQAAVMQDGYSIVPLKVYFVKGRAKMEIALAKGKKAWDKRHALAERQAPGAPRTAIASRGTTGSSSSVRLRAATALRVAMHCAACCCRRWKAHP